MDKGAYELDFFLLSKYFASKWKIISLIFFFILVFPLAYVATHEAEYESKGAILVGRLALEVPTSARSRDLIENADEISYLYGDRISVSDVRDTRVVEISVLRPTKAESEREVNQVIDDILDRHSSCGEVDHLYRCEVLLSSKTIRYGLVATKVFSHGKRALDIIFISFLVAALVPFLIFLLLGIKLQLVSDCSRASFAN